MFSGFIDYSLPLGKFNILAGLRYEFQQTDYYEKGIHQDGQKPHLPRLDTCNQHQIHFRETGFLALSHRTLKYSPSYDMLTSAITYQNKYSYQSGEPFLVPQIHRSTTFDVGWKWVNFNINYDHCWNMYTNLHPTV